MRRALLILASAWAGTAVIALPCPTCPKQMLYLPASAAHNPVKGEPSQKTNSLPFQAPAYPQNSFPGNNIFPNNKEPELKYGHRTRTLGLEEAKAEHDRYIYDTRRMGNPNDFRLMTKRR